MIFLFDVAQKEKEQLSFPHVFSGNPEYWMPDYPD
jgi:hypothetical protein